MLQASGFAARVSLVDSQGQPLVQSDGTATGAGDGLIDVNVPAGMTSSKCRVSRAVGLPDHRRLDSHRPGVSDGPERLLRLLSDRRGQLLRRQSPR